MANDISLKFQNKVTIRKWSWKKTFRKCVIITSMDSASLAIGASKSTSTLSVKIKRVKLKPVLRGIRRSVGTIVATVGANLAHIVFMSISTRKIILEKKLTVLKLLSDF